MSWETAARSPLPHEDWFYGWLAEPGEVFLPPLIATDWTQYLAAAPLLGRKAATLQSRFHLFLTDRRLVIAYILGPTGQSLGISLQDVIKVEVIPPPGRKFWGWKVVRKLYRVEVMRILYRTETGMKFVDYDAASDTEPFAARLREHVARYKARRRQHP